MKPMLHFLYVAADVKVYYQYILVHKKRGVIRLWEMVNNLRLFSYMYFEPQFSYRRFLYFVTHIFF